MRIWAVIFLCAPNSVPVICTTFTLVLYNLIEKYGTLSNHSQWEPCHPLGSHVMFERDFTDWKLWRYCTLICSGYILVFQGLPQKVEIGCLACNPWQSLNTLKKPLHVSMLTTLHSWKPDGDLWGVSVFDWSLAFDPVWLSQHSVFCLLSAFYVKWKQRFFSSHWEPGPGSCPSTDVKVCNILVCWARTDKRHQWHFGSIRFLLSTLVLNKAFLKLDVETI